MAGPFIDTEYETLAKSEVSYGRNGQCAALAQRSGGSGAPNSSEWKPGTRVLDAAAGDIAKGTVIATFWGGIYPAGGGMHTALYLGHDAGKVDAKGKLAGAWIEVVDQWEVSHTEKVEKDGVVEVVKVKTAYPPKKARQERGGNGRIKGNPYAYIAPAGQTGANAPATRPRLSNVAEYYHVVMTT